jgi:hypothetical protein
LVDALLVVVGRAMGISHRLWGWRSIDEFPSCCSVAGWLTGDAFCAERDGKFYIIVDETVLAYGRTTVIFKPRADQIGRSMTSPKDMLGQY